MIATSSFLHPAIGFIALAVLLPLWQARGWRWLILLPPIIAIAAVLGMDSGTFWQFNYLGVDLTLGRVDKLSVIFAHVFAVQALIGFIFALHLRDKYQHIAASLYIAGAFGCVFAGDYLTLFIFWELMSVASTVLVWLNMSSVSTRAGFRYFAFHTLGGLLLLAGLLLRFGDIGTFAFTAINPLDAQYYDWLIMLGFCVNAAVVPLHAWLPDTYPEGSVTGSVFMSAFTTKTAVYVLARAFGGWEILGVAGVVMCLYGVFYATIENNARRILSYHIVSQVGYMVAGIGIGTAMTMNGACAHAYAHILYKGLLFMTTGVLLYSCGTAKLSELGGLASRMPLVMICYLVAGFSISGMPLFNGFISKTMTITGAAEAHHTWLALGMEVAAVGTFLSVGIKLPYYAFWGKKPVDKTRQLKPIPTNMYVAMFMGAGLCVLQGIFPGMLYDLLPYELVAGHGAIPEPSHVLAAFDVGYTPWTVGHVLASVLLLGFTAIAFYNVRNIIAPHPSRNLDFDYLYRVIGNMVRRLISLPLAAIDGVWTSVYRLVGLKWLMGFAKGASIFDRRAIDGVVDGSAYTVRGVSRIAAKAQTGVLQDYLAFAVLLGLGIFALIWFTA
ncbi:MAG: Na(+)/H(+) antiporter subunit D [Proteobacteria bacterium]|nr:Na(+)/H(+) antiporter subunit D [Pseudomonadota bacterium]